MCTRRTRASLGGACHLSSIALAGVATVFGKKLSAIFVRFSFVRAVSVANFLRAGHVTIKTFACVAAVAFVKGVAALVFFAVVLATLEGASFSVALDFAVFASASVAAVSVGECRAVLVSLTVVIAGLPRSSACSFGLHGNTRRVGDTAVAVRFAVTSTDRLFYRCTTFGFRFAFTSFVGLAAVVGLIAKLFVFARRSSPCATRSWSTSHVGTRDLAVETGACVATIVRLKALTNLVGGSFVRASSVHC